MDRRVLVIGTRTGSLGFEIANRIETWRDVAVFSADAPGVPQDEYHYHVDMDVGNREQVVNILHELQPTDVVCCAGINLPDDNSTINHMRLQLQSNTWGPLQVLVETVALWQMLYEFRDLGDDFPLSLNFVAVSSNSAHIPRSQSMGYCASKAALSMGLRCMARRYASGPINIWGYEPGWINGTPMSEEVIDRIGSDDPYRLHRIPSGRGMDKAELARRITDDLQHAHKNFNGAMFRIDGGDA